MYYVITRRPASALSRGDRGVRAPKLDSEFVRMDDAKAYAELKHREGLYAAVVDVIYEAGPKE